MVHIKKSLKKKPNKQKKPPDGSVRKKTVFLKHLFYPVQLNLHKTP